MKKIFTICFLFFFIISALMLTSFKVKPKKILTNYHKTMFSGGITGQSASGCSCHGATATTTVAVSVTGLPANPIVGVTYPLLFNLTGTNPYAGYNLAVTSGTLNNTDGDSYISGDELTHVAPKPLVSNAVTFAFEWTPTTPGAVTFTYAGNNVDGGGTGGDRWNIGSAVTNVQTLPVKIAYVNGLNVAANTNTIFWKAEQEVNFLKYEIENSCDGLQFNFVGTVMPLRTTAYSKNYEFTHQNVICNNKSFYRLKLINLDGTFEYSSVISINKIAKDVKATLYPNPVTNIDEKIVVNTGNRKVRFIQLVSAEGKIVQTYAGVNRIINELDLPATMKRGTYFITIFYENKQKQSISLIY